MKSRGAVSAGVLDVRGAVGVLAWNARNAAHRASHWGVSAIWTIRARVCRSGENCRELSRRAVGADFARRVRLVPPLGAVLALPAPWSVRGNCVVSICSACGARRLVFSGGTPITLHSARATGKPTFRADLAVLSGTPEL